MGDGHLALAALVFERACILLFALLLQHPLGRQRSTRYAAGALTAAAILLVGPCIYSTPTQMWGVTCAAFGCLASWCVLHWTFLEDPDRSPTVLEVVLSPTRHSLEGVIKVHQRWLQLKARRSKTAAADQGVPHKQPQPQQQSSSAACSQPNLWALLHEAALALAVAHVTYDLGTHLLCSFSGGMCSAGTGAAGLSAAAVAAGQAPSYLAQCAFALPAGILLTQQMEVVYGTIRVCMILAAFRWPGLGELAAQLPTHAFKLPVAAGSVSELWGFRWHQFLRYYFEGLGSALVHAVLPKDKAPSAVRASMRCVAAFLMSGLLHEYVTWAAFGTVTWRHLTFFLLNGAAALLESWAPAVLAACWQAQGPAGTSSRSSTGACTVTAHVTAKVHPVKSGKTSSSSGSDSSSAAKLNGYKMQALLPGWLQHAITLSFFILLGPLFVEPYRAAAFFSERAFHPFGQLVTPRVLGWMQQGVSQLA